MSKELLDLKPCPFCAGDGEVMFSGKRYDSNEYWKGYIIVRCCSCGASAKGSFYEGRPIEIPLELTIGGERAAHNWNRRVNRE